MKAFSVFPLSGRRCDAHLVLASCLIYSTCVVLRIPDLASLTFCISLGSGGCFEDTATLMTGRGHELGLVDVMRQVCSLNPTAELEAATAITPAIFAMLLFSSYDVCPRLASSVAYISHNVITFRVLFARLTAAKTSAQAILYFHSSR